MQCYNVAAGYPNQITTRMSQVSVKINHDSGNRPNSTKLADCRRRHALLLEHRHTHARGKRQRRRRRQTDRHSLARLPSPFVRRRSVRLGSHHPSPLSVTSSGESASGDRHQRDLPSYVAQSVQPPARSLSSSSSTRGRRCTRSMFASLFGAACAAVSMSMSFAQPTLLASAMLRISCVLSSLHPPLGSRSPPPSFTASR